MISHFLLINAEDLDIGDIICNTYGEICGRMYILVKRERVKIADDDWQKSETATSAVTSKDKSELHAYYKTYYTFINAEIGNIISIQLTNKEKFNVLRYFKSV